MVRNIWPVTFLKIAFVVIYSFLSIFLVKNTEKYVNTYIIGCILIVCNDKPFPYLCLLANSYLYMPKMEYKQHEKFDPNHIFLCDS